MATEGIQFPMSRDFASHPNDPTHARQPSSSSGTTLDAENPVPLHRVPTAEDMINLPIRTLSNNANLNEYIQETISGQMVREVRSNAGKVEKYDLVTFTIDDKENPKNWSKAYKWWCTMCVAITCFVVAFNSAVVTADTFRGWIRCRTNGLCSRV
jgi:hypothetical protein